MNLSPVNWAEVGKHNRVFFLDNGDVLIFSKLQWQDLPIQGAAWPTPGGARYERERKRYGPTLARFYWRQREGVSRLGSGALAALAYPEAHVSHGWKTYWWRIVDWISPTST